MYKKITFLALLTFFVSCKKADREDLDKNEKEIIKTAHWLLGQWETKSEDGTLTEDWQKVNDSTYTGQCFFLKGEDTIHHETIVLQQIDEQLNYNTVIRGQNNNKAIAYLLMEAKENKLVFENLNMIIHKKLLIPKFLKTALL